MSSMSGVPAALYKLLAQASSLPCSSGAAAFLSLVPIQNDWFPLALNALVPVLQDQDIQIPQRILAAYLLYDLYHDQQNPFDDRLFRIFELERAASLRKSNSFESLNSPETRLSSSRGGSGNSNLQAENEQLVWVLWKILKGEGKDLAPYSPNILSRTALPEHLRALHLVIRDVQNYNNNVTIDDLYSPDTEVPRLATATHNYATTFEHEPSMPMPTTRTSSTSSFSPFDNDDFTDLRNHRHEDGLGNSAANGLAHEQPSNPMQHEHYQLTSDLPRRPFANSHSTHSNLQLDIAHQHSSLPPTSIRPAVTEAGRRQALLRALYTEPARGGMEETYLPGGVARSRDQVEDSSGARRINSDTQIEHESSQGLQMQQSQHQKSSTFHSHAHAKINHQSHNSTSPHNGLDMSGTDRDSISFPSAFSSPINPMTSTRLTSDSIPRPSLSPSSYYSSAPPHDHKPPVVDRLQASDSFTPHMWRGSLQHSYVTEVDGLPQQGSSTNKLLQRAHSPVSQPSRVRNPGVIGSGRPSFKPTHPVSPGSLTNSNAVKDRSDVGVIGNGRPVKEPPRDPDALGKNSDVTGEDLLSPFVPRVENIWEGARRRDYGAIGRPKQNAVEKGGRASGFELMEKNSSSAGQRAQLSVRTVPSPQPNQITPEISQVEPWSSGPYSSSGSAQSQSPVFDHTRSALDSLTPEQHFIPAPITPSLNNGIDSDKQVLTLSQPNPPASASTSPHSQPIQQPEIFPVRIAGQKDVLQSEVNEKERDELSRAIVLLLSARERVLTLPEQRMLIPHLSMLTRPLSLLRPGDLHPLIAKNPDVAAKLLVLLLDRDDEDGARVERVLRNVSKNDLFRMEQGLVSQSEPSSYATSPDPLDTAKTIRSAVDFIGSYGDQSTETSGLDEVFPFGGREAKEGYLDALRKLPPTMQSFNLIARLLRPTQFIAASPTAAAEPLEELPEMKVAKVVKEGVLGALMSGCVQWIEKAEREEKEGEVLDDRVAVSVSSLSRFYSSLLKHGFVSASSEVDSTEIMSFALQFSRFEEARNLYSILAAARV